jgi:lysozyme
MILVDNVGLNWTSEGRAFIEAWEDCVLRPYQDASGRWTVGWGETGPHVDVLAEMPDATITRYEADAWFLMQLDKRRDAILDMVRVPIDPQHLDALLSFAYNLGVDALRGSTLLRLLNRGLFMPAADEFEKWDNVRINGVLTPNRGLLRRRLGERSIFTRGDYSLRP